MSIKTQTIMGRLLMFDEIIKGKAEVVRQVEDVMLVVEPVDTFRHKEYNCPDKMQEERKEHRRNTENQTQDFHPNSIKKAYFLLSLHFVIWLDDLSISIMILELLVLFWKIDRSSQLYMWLNEFQPRKVNILTIWVIPVGT
jgi:hypothetical protein